MNYWCTCTFDYRNVYFLGCFGVAEMEVLAGMLSMCILLNCAVLLNVSDAIDLLLFEGILWKVMMMMSSLVVNLLLSS